MFELAERRAQQSMLKTYWTPDTSPDLPLGFWRSLSLFSFENRLGEILLHVAADLNDPAQTISQIREMSARQTFRAQRTVTGLPKWASHSRNI
jgi:hypothetical protein